MVKEQKMTRGDVIGTIIGIAICVIIMYFMIRWVDTPTESMQDYCKEQGYEKATDEYHCFPRSEGLAKVECDGKDIFPIERFKVCTKYNKWKTCDYYEFKYRSSNVSC